MYDKKIAEILLNTGAVKMSLNPLFTWTSGIKSPIYCDNRLLIAFSEERKVVVEGFKDLIKANGLSFDYIAGTATAAIPWAAFLAYELGFPMVYIRPEPKGHGAGKQIEGLLKPGSRVLLVEDLISTGGSSLKAVEAIKNEGKSELVAVLSIMTYEMVKAKENFEKAGIKYYSITNFSVLAAEAKARGTIDNLDLVMEFQKDPENFANKLN